MSNKELGEVEKIGKKWFGDKQELSITHTLSLPVRAIGKARKNHVANIFFKFKKAILFKKVYFIKMCNKKNFVKKSISDQISVKSPLKISDRGPEIKKKFKRIAKSRLKKN